MNIQKTSISIVSLGMLMSVIISACTTGIPILVDPLPAFTKADSTIHRGEVSLQWGIHNKAGVPVASFQLNLLLPRDNESDSTILVESMWTGPDYFITNHCLHLQSKNKASFLSGNNSYDLMLDIDYSFPSKEIPLKPGNPKTLVDYDTVTFTGDNVTIGRGSDILYCLQDPSINTLSGPNAHVGTHFDFEIHKVDGKWEILHFSCPNQDDIDFFKDIISSRLGEGWANLEDYYFSYAATVEEF